MVRQFVIGWYRRDLSVGLIEHHAQEESSSLAVSSARLLDLGRGSREGGVSCLFGEGKTRRRQLSKMQVTKWRESLP